MTDVRLIDAELLRINIAQIAKACAKSDKQKALVGRILFMIENMPTIEAQPVNQEIIELLNECRETIFGATYTSGEEYTYAITLCDKISAVIGEGKQ